ncbi:MAG TPA: hypothetical protein VGI10_16965 [Polyangiaceae bacterium]|jgi:hypothetical protein
MKLRLPLLGLLGLLALVAPSALADSTQVLSGARIRLDQIGKGYEDELRELDLGAAPPPGSTRHLMRSEVLERLRAAGDDGKRLKMPEDVWVKSAAKRFSPDELRVLLEAPLTAALPPLVTLRQIKLTRPITTSPSIQIGEVRVPKFPKQQGQLTVTATVELRREDAVLVRLPVPIVIDISEEAARPAMEKGARVRLVIDRGPARVTALAFAMSDGELGEVELFKVASTQRLLRAKIETADTARVVE